MTDHAELIAELLAEVRSDGYVIAGPSDLDRRTADALSSLVRERDEARERLAHEQKLADLGDSRAIAAEDERDAFLQGVRDVDALVSARVASAEAERDEAMRVAKNNADLWGEACKMVDEQRAATQAAEADAARMRKALEPFEDVSGEGDEDFPDDTKVTVTFGRTTFYDLRLGDFRRARNALGGKDE